MPLNPRGTNLPGYVGAEGDKGFFRVGVGSSGIISFKLGGGNFLNSRWSVSFKWTEKRLNHRGTENTEIKLERDNFGTGATVAESLSYVKDHGDINYFATETSTRSKKLLIY